MGKRRRMEKEESKDWSGTLGEAAEAWRKERRRPSWEGGGWRGPVGSGRERWRGEEGWSWETALKRKKGSRRTGRAAQSRGKQQALT